MEANKVKTQFNQDMSDPVFNFGLKLYNFQNLNQLSELLGASQLPLPLNEGRNFDPGYEHTEYQLLRKLYGDLALNKMQGKVTEERIKNRIQRNLLHFEGTTVTSNDLTLPLKISETFSYSQKDTQKS